MRHTAMNLGLWLLLVSAVRMPCCCMGSVERHPVQSVYADYRVVMAPRRTVAHSLDRRRNFIKTGSSAHES